MILLVQVLGSSQAAIRMLVVASWREVGVWSCHAMHTEFQIMRDTGNVIETCSETMSIVLTVFYNVLKNLFIG